METTLYYFTGTGNSLFAAKNIAKKTGCFEIIPMAGKLNVNTLSADTPVIGFIFPLYYQTMPKIVEEFINKIDLQKTVYIFSVVTRGAKFMGDALRNLNRLLKEKSKKLNYGAYIEMPDNFITLLKVPGKEKQNKIFNNAEQKIDKISAKILSNINYLEKEPFSFLKILKKTNKYKKIIYVNDKNFNAESNCNSCGICEKLCSVNNIKLIQGKPQWQGKCMDCLGCINLCPSQAIQYAKLTLGKARYHHPEITLNDLIIQKK